VEGEYPHLKEVREFGKLMSLVICELTRVGVEGQNLDGQNKLLIGLFWGRSPYTTLFKYKED
jgi:hypothetical protein